MRSRHAVELEGFSVQVKTFPPAHVCRWPRRVPGRLCVFLDGTMQERGASDYGVRDVVYKPPEDRPRLRFGERGARTVTIELREHGLESLRRGGVDVSTPFALRSTACHLTAERLRRELADGDRWTPLVVEGLVLDLFARSHRELSFRRAPRWLERVWKRIEREFASSHTLGDYARDAGVHPVHLASCYRRHYHRSVGEHIRTRRVHQAAMELCASEKSLAAIAADLGFSDQSHFSRTFKKVLGLTPGAYRRGRA